MSESLQRLTPLRIIAAIFSALFVGSAIYIVPFQLLVGMFIGITFALIFCLYPAKRGRTKEHIPAYDIVFALAALGMAVYFIFRYNEIQRRAGLLTEADQWVAAIAIIVSLEVARRVLGWVLPTLVILLFAYNILGPVIPGPMGHPGFPVRRMLGASFTGTGIFGLVASVFARYVVLFVVFGAVMQATGVIYAILEMSQALTKNLRAGPAKAGILASGGIGSVVGQSIANIAITAPMTVPMMRKAGFSAEKAGGLEVVASTGGQVLPPVMGAGAFLVAQFAGTSYGNVVAIALAPAILFYISLLASAHFEAGTEGVGYVSTEKEESVWSVFKRTYWAFVPIAVLLVLLLVVRMTPFRAAFWSILVALAFFALRSRSGRQTAAKLYEGLTEGTFSLLTMASTAGVIGLVIAMVNLPGLPTTLSQNMFDLVRGNLLGAFFMIVLISLIMGMGMTVTASYAVVAVLGAPLLDQFGVPVLIAHLVIFWLSQDSSVTPPFALGSFVVAGISGGHVWKTSWYAFKYAKALYIVPLLMIYSPLATGSPLEILSSSIIAAIGLIYTAAAFAGFFKAPLSWWSRLFLGGAALLTLWPDAITSAIGIFTGLALWLFQRHQNLREVGHPDLLVPEVHGTSPFEPATGDVAQAERE